MTVSDALIVVVLVHNIHGNPWPSSYGLPSELGFPSYFSLEKIEQNHQGKRRSFCPVQ